MKDSLANPATHINKVWCEAAFNAAHKTNEMEIFIDNIKTKLKKEANLKMEYTSESAREVFDEDDLKAVETVFNEKNLAEELKQKMLVFRDDILKIDTALNSYFENDHSVYFPNEKGKTVYQMYFKNLPTAGALTMLTKFKNDITVFKYEVIEYCDHKSKALH